MAQDTKISAHDEQKAELINPSLPLSKVEREMYGPTSYRLPLSGWPCEMGSGALPPEQQDQAALRRVEAYKRRPTAIPVEQFTSRPLGSPDTSKPWRY